MEWGAGDVVQINVRQSYKKADLGVWREKAPFPLVAKIVAWKVASW